MKTYKDSAKDIFYVDISRKLTKPKKNNAVISLFSGAGGLDIGLENAGFQTLACVEMDKDCRATLKANRPQWNLLEDCFLNQIGDVREISGEKILDEIGLRKGQVAIVCGGAPCQPFSNIGKKQGRNDLKNGDLFLEFVRIVSETLPSAFIFENVAGIKQQRHSEVINYMEEQCARIGYSVSGKILVASDYGVAQKRERFFLIGMRGNNTPLFPLPTHCENEQKWERFCSNIEPKPSLKIEKWRTLKDVFDELLKQKKRSISDVRMNISDIVVERMKQIGPGQNFKVLPMEMRPNCWK